MPPNTTTPIHCNAGDLDCLRRSADQNGPPSKHPNVTVRVISLRSLIEDRRNGCSKSIELTVTNVGAEVIEPFSVMTNGTGLTSWVDDDSPPSSAEVFELQFDALAPGATATSRVAIDIPWPEDTLKVVRPELKG